MYVFPSFSFALHLLHMNPYTSFPTLSLLPPPTHTLPKALLLLLYAVSSFLTFSLLPPPTNTLPKALLLLSFPGFLSFLPYSHHSQGPPPLS
jgi:hypothetical protein